MGRSIVNSDQISSSPLSAFPPTLLLSSLGDGCRAVWQTEMGSDSKQACGCPARDWHIGRSAGARPPPNPALSALIGEVGLYVTKVTDWQEPSFA